MRDERLNLPSASSAQRIMECPGSFQLEEKARASIPPVPKAEETLRGQLIHDAYAGSPEAEAQLTGSEQDTLAIARSWEKGLCEEFFGKQPYTTDREKRLFLHERLQPIFSGRFDFRAVSHDLKRALVLDLKTGWDDDLPASPENWQLRSYAVIIAQHLAKDATVGVAINAPHLGRPTLCVYGPEELGQAERELRIGLEVASYPDAPRIAGTRQCKFCDAAAICPEAQEVSSQLAIRADVQLLTPEERGHRVELLKLGITLAEKELATYKEMLSQDPASVAGYRLKPGRMMKPVTDPLRCYQQANSIVTDEEMMRCCKVSKEQLEEIVRRKTGKKGKALAAVMATIYEGAISEVQTAPSLERSEAA